ncbi:DUF6320 domain-containing protein [Larkinella insperata]|uniref:DUF6320 domain-containing protein n=1 Tax=Larkinella insperata TaxID=332158 RepID=A0ABW3QB26_9BACT
MNDCKNCGVELEYTMLMCPLCGQAVAGNQAAVDKSDDRTDLIANKPARRVADGQEKTHQSLVWEILTIMLISGIMATLVINFLLSKRITWAQYPVCICLVILAYGSLLTFCSRTHLLVSIAGGFISSSVVLLIRDSLGAEPAWGLKIAIPILGVGSLIATGLVIIIRKSTSKGINLFAYLLIGGGLFCISIESILSVHQHLSLNLEWSLIVMLSVLLVSIVLLFMHFRLKKGRSLAKTFHI